MAERYDLAATRHLKSGNALEGNARLDDAGYHYGLAGEMAIKRALQSAGIAKPKPFHIDHNSSSGKDLLRYAIREASNLTVLASGRKGLALVQMATSLGSKFQGWSMNKLRYADDGYCPIDAAKVSAWHQDAIALVNAVI
jgi:hypothetical protein